MADFRKLNAEDLELEEISDCGYKALANLTDDELDVYDKYIDKLENGEYDSDFFNRDIAEIRKDLKDDSVTEAVAIALYWEAADNEEWNDLMSIFDELDEDEE